MKKLLICLVVIFTGSCGYEPTCKMPGEAELAFPIEMKEKNTKLYVLNSDAGTGFCSGYISEFDLSGNSPVWIRHIFPSPLTGNLPHMLGGFDISNDYIAVTDRYYGQVLITHVNSYSVYCHPRNNREACATEVIDSFRDPLQAVFLDHAKMLLVSSTPYGSVRLYSQQNGTFTISTTYTFVAPLTTALTSFISPVRDGVIITYRESAEVYYLKLTDTSLVTETSRTFSFGSSETGGIREAADTGSSIILLSTGPSLVFLTDKTLSPFRSFYPGSFPSSITFSNGILAVTLQEEGKISFFTLPSLTHIGSVEVCTSPTKVIALHGTAAEFAVACFYEHKIAGVTVEGEIVWELK